MHIPLGVVSPDVKSLNLAELIEVSASTAREEGRKEDATALFRLRIKIREGLPYDEAKKIFDKHCMKG